MFTIINHNRNDGDQLQFRIRLDRRRLESAHLKYAMLRLQSRHPLTSKIPIKMTSDVSDMLQKFTPVFYEAFSKAFSGEYHT